MATAQADRASIEKHPLLDFGPDIVNVTVGRDYDDNRKTFCVRRQIISNSSRLVNRTLNASDGIIKSIQLENHEPDLFNIYLNWLYKGLVHMPRTYVDEYDGQVYGQEERVQAEYGALIQLYLLGLEIEDIYFQNAIVDIILAKWEADPTTVPDQHNLIYVFMRSRAHGSCLAKLLVKMYVISATPEAMGVAPGNFSREVAREFAAMRGQPVGDSNSLSNEAFHEDPIDDDNDEDDEADDDDEDDSLAEPPRKRIRRDSPQDRLYSRLGLRLGAMSKGLAPSPSPESLLPAFTLTPSGSLLPRSPSPHLPPPRSPSPVYPPTHRESEPPFARPSRSPWQRGESAPSNLQSQILERFTPAQSETGSEEFDGSIMGDESNIGYQDASPVYGNMRPVPGTSEFEPRSPTFGR